MRVRGKEERGEKAILVCSFHSCVNSNIPRIPLKYYVNTFDMYAYSCIVGSEYIRMHIIGVFSLLVLSTVAVVE